MPKCNFNKVAIEISLQRGCSLVNLLHIFRIPFCNSTYGELLLEVTVQKSFSEKFRKNSHENPSD